MTQIHTIRDMAKLAKGMGRRVSEGYLRRLCRDGAMPGARKIGPAWVVPAKFAENWLAEWTRAE